MFSTSPLGTIVALDESKLQQGLLVVGTDDGLVRISRDNGNIVGDTSELSWCPTESLCY